MEENIDKFISKLCNAILKRETVVLKLYLENKLENRNPFIEEKSTWIKHGHPFATPTPSHVQWCSVMFLVCHTLGTCLNLQDYAIWKQASMIVS